ncbi:MAG: zinc-dependent metalloprotease, partial [Candidatus Poribacteria bacterium]|nr:zinc-dependent metalloprotease [Candidatus Poribacteria bacterium]
PTLNALAVKQSDDPVLRFGWGSYIDPSAQTEDLGADPVAATRYGLMNIERVAAMLIPATTTNPGDDYDELRNLYNDLIGQRNRELGHVIGLVGGVVQTNYHVGQEGIVYAPVSREKQKEAMTFLAENAFTTPTSLIDPNLLGLIEPSGNVGRVASAQSSLLNQLLDDGRAQRLVDHAAMADDREPRIDPYPLGEMLADLRDAVWGELNGEAVVIDPYRRQLQRAHVENLGGKVNGGGRSDLPAFARGELRRIDQAAETALGRAQDDATRLHLEDIRERIEAVLEPSGRR